MNNGDKSKDRPKTNEVRPLVRAYKNLDGNAVGGSLHCVLDDPNYDDGSVRWCQEYAMERMDQAGVFLAEILLMMTKTQRRLVA